MALICTAVLYGGERCIIPLSTHLKCGFRFIAKKSENHDRPTLHRLCNDAYSIAYSRALINCELYLFTDCTSLRYDDDIVMGCCSIIMPLGVHVHVHHVIIIN